MKFLQFYIGLALSKGCCVGKWFGRLWQNQLCSLWPHSGISKPWKTSLGLLPLLPQQRLKKQNCTVVVPKPRTNTSTHIHLSLQGPSSSPPGLSILIQLHPLSCGGSKEPLESTHSFGKPDVALVYYYPYRNLAGLHLGKKKKKPKRFILQPNLKLFSDRMISPSMGKTDQEVEVICIEKQMEISLWVEITFPEIKIIHFTALCFVHFNLSRNQTWPCGFPSSPFALCDPSLCWCASQTATLHFRLRQPN